jgi:dolichol kinase
MIMRKAFLLALLVLQPSLGTSRTIGSGATPFPSSRSLTRVHLKYDSISSRSVSTTQGDTNALSRGGSIRPPIGRTKDEDVVKVVEEDTTATAPTDGSVSTTDTNALATTITPTNAENDDDDTTTTTTDVAVPASAASSKKGGLLWFHKKSKGKNYKKYAKKLKNRNATNVRRKVLHCSWGLLFAALNHFIPKKIFLTGMCVLSTGTLAMELLRYRPGFQWMNDILHLTLGSSLRKHEMEGKFTGSFYFFTGVTVTAALFDPNAATLGICQLALADPSASYFGRATRHVYWSRIENGLGGIGRNKGLLGFLGGALVCFPFNYRVLSIAKYVVMESSSGTTSRLPGGKPAVVLASLALGFAGALADLAVPSPAVVLPKRVWGVRVPPLHVDDNFVVPIVSAWACEKVFAALHWNAASVQLGKFLLLDHLLWFNGKAAIQAAAVTASSSVAAAVP